MIVLVVDQAGAIVKDARVAVVNNATGAVREAISGTDGSVNIPALSVSGTYAVNVSRQGFGNEEIHCTGATTIIRLFSINNAFRWWVSLE